MEKKTLSFKSEEHPLADSLDKTDSENAVRPVGMRIGILEIKYSWAVAMFPLTH